MALQKGVVRLSGKIGPVVFYEKDGRGMAKAAADKKNYNLSEGSRKTSLEFKTANTAASLFRQAFKPILDNTADKNFIHRLKSKFIQIINTGPEAKKGERQVTDGDVSLLKQIEFNSFTDLKRLVSFLPVIEVDPFDKLRIVIPKLTTGKAFKAHPKAINAVMQFICCSFDLAGRDGRFAWPDDLVVPLADKFFRGGSLELPLEYTDDRLVVVVMGINFLQANGRLVGDRKWYAGKILEAVFIKDGRIVSFEYPEPVKVPVIEEEIKRVGWILNDDDT